jgi:phosphate transport system substrate-binding protein
MRATGPAVALALAVALFAVAPGVMARAAAAAARPPAGEVVCAGGDTLQGLVRAWAAGVARRDSAVTVRLETDDKLAAEGFHRLLVGQANCVTLVREPFPSELAAFQARFGHPPTLVPVAGGSFATRGGTHAIAILVNAANPLPGLTLSQLAAVLGQDGRARRWGDLGLTGAWAERPIHVYGMLHQRPSGDPPGVVNFVRQRVLQGAPLRADIAEQVDRPGEQALAAIVRQVGEDPDGLGYSGFGYATSKVRALPLAEHDGGPYVAGDRRSVAERRYPLSRRVYILVDRPPGAPLAPPLRALLDYALSPAGQAAIARDPEGFLPLTPTELAAARRSLR